MDTCACTECSRKDKLIQYTQEKLSRYAQLSNDAVTHIVSMQSIINNQRAEIERLQKIIADFKNIDK